MADTIKDTERLHADRDITRHKKQFDKNIKRRQNFKAKLENGTYTMGIHINVVVYTLDSSVSRLLPADSSDEGGLSNTTFITQMVKNNVYMNFGAASA